MPQQSKIFLILLNKYKLKQFILKDLIITLYNIKTLQDFAIDIVYSINKAFDDLIVYISIVVMYLKDFSSSLRENS